MSKTYCDMYCKHHYLFGTSWDLRCGRTDLIQNEEYQNNTNRYGSVDNRVCFIERKYDKDCLQYQMAKQSAMELKEKLKENDEAFQRFYDIINNPPHRCRGTIHKKVDKFIEIFDGE